MVTRDCPDCGAKGYVRSGEYGHPDFAETTCMACAGRGYIIVQEPAKEKGG
jgi:DnaJ-class molecular chaperone